jgi:hypothetical protein
MRLCWISTTIEHGGPRDDARTLQLEALGYVVPPDIVRKVIE